jgi:hypothetical protein
MGLSLVTVKTAGATQPASVDAEFRLGGFGVYGNDERT